MTKEVRQLISQARIALLNNGVVFNAGEHTYHLKGRLLRGVSGIVSRYKEPFDAEYWAAKKAKERGCEPEVLLDEWAAKARKACDEGTEFHEHAQFQIEKKGKTSDAAKPKLFDPWWNAAREHLVPVACEVVLHNEEHGIAGTADLIAYSTKTALFHVFDWKTNGKFTTESDYNKKMLKPFHNLPESSLSGYSIQVGIYRYMARKLSGLPFGDSWIMHFGEKLTPHRALNLDAEIEKALKNL